MKPQDEQLRQLAQDRISVAVRDSRHDDKGNIIMSQATAAKDAGISEEFLGRIERGEALPSIPTLMRLVWLLGLDIVDIFRQAKPPAV